MGKRQIREIEGRKPAKFCAINGHCRKGKI